MCAAPCGKKDIFQGRYSDPRTAWIVFVVCLHGESFFVLSIVFGMPSGERTRIFTLNVSVKRNIEVSQLEPEKGPRMRMP